jgi:peroxiredoxin
MLPRDSYAQESYRLEFRIDELPRTNLSLVLYYGDQQIRVDSAATDASGNIAFIRSATDEVGMYRLQKDQKAGLDFLFNKEDVVIAANSDLSLSSIEVKKSKENEIFFDYFRHKYDMQDRLEILSGFLRYYPPADTFYYTVAAHAESLSTQYTRYLDSLRSHYPNLLVTEVIRFDQLPDIRPGELDPAAIQYFKSHYFDGADLTDSLILNTPILPAKIIDYLSLYVMPGVQREQQEALFTQAVDSLMKFSEGGGKTKEMIVNYLITGFQAYGFEGVLTHLVENYVLGQSCVSDQEEEKLRLRIEGFKKLSVGTLAPDFEAIDSKGNPVRLSALRGKKVVLVFWAGDCPHCAAILPEVGNLYAQYREKAEFIGISADDDDKTWREALAEENLQFINIAELKGWNGKIVTDYYIYATPTFFVLDGNGRITAKPAGLAELRAALEK